MHTHQRYGLLTLWALYLASRTARCVRLFLSFRGNRIISIARLSVLPRVQLQPINVVIFHDPSGITPNETSS